MNIQMKSRRFAGSALLTTMLVLAGCAVGPEYTPPEVTTPATFKEAAAPGVAGTWKTAQPADAAHRGQWWRAFDDEKLNDLQDQAVAANQDLAAALARVKEARALAQSSRADLFPAVNAGFGPTRQQQSPASLSLPSDANVPGQTLWRAQAGLSYEVDLFGRVSSTINAAQANAQETEALYRAVLLTLQADVAQRYFQLRGLDAEAAVFTQAVKLREDALAVISHRYAAGEIDELDLARSKAELASARADALGIQRQRAVSEHALAVLLGKAPADFSFAPTPLTPVILNIPAGLPSALLERRPDIAAAERAMAGANARIGAAKAAFFPSLTLTAAGGFESASLGDLFNWSSRTFLLGPLVGTALNLPIFDGGRRTARLEQARATYEQEVAVYRQKVLTAFKEVEDNLSDIRLLASQTRLQADAVSSAARAAELSRIQYREGAINYLDVIDAERTVLTNRRAQAQLTSVQAMATVNLIRALGGGWDTVPEAAPIVANR